MSIEQLSNGEYDCSCDVWAVGVLSYYLFELRYPFDGQSEGELTQNVKNISYRRSQTEGLQSVLDSVFVAQEERMSADEWLKRGAF